MDIVNRYKFYALTDKEKQELKNRGLEINVEFVFIDKDNKSFFDDKGIWCVILLLSPMYIKTPISVCNNDINYYFAGINIYEKPENYVACFYKNCDEEFLYDADWNKDNSKAIQLLRIKMPHFWELVFNIRQLCSNNYVCEDVIKYILTFI
jgi:hypothetical protein